MGRILQTLELAAGSLILSVGLAIAAIFAANEHFVGVFTGFALFIIGYEISQYSVYNSEDSKMQGFVEDMIESIGMQDVFMAVVGLGTVTYGATLLYDSIQQTQLTLAVLASILLFGGYILAHYAINNTLV